MRVNSSSPSSSIFVSGPMISCTSPPEQKLPPAPRITTAFTSCASVERAEGVAKLGIAFERQRVLPLGPVERDRRDAVLELPQEVLGREGRRVEAHALVPPSMVIAAPLMSRLSGRQSVSDQRSRSPVGSTSRPLAFMLVIAERASLFAAARDLRHARDRLVGHRRVDIAGADRVHGHLRLGIFGGQAAHQAEQAVLRRGIMRRVGHAAKARDRGDEDQPAVLALEQVGKRRLRAVERAR